MAKLGPDKAAISGGMHGAPEEHIPVGKELMVKFVLPAMVE